MKLNPKILFLALFAGWPGIAGAGVPDPDAAAAKEKTLSPYLIVLGQEEAEGETEPLPLKHTAAKVEISGIIADVEIRQVYRNTGKNVLEAVYVFPGSTRSAVHGLEMKIGERVTVAKIEEKTKAKATYEKAKKESKSAALLEQKRPNVFQMNVGHILPGDEIAVTLKYTEVLTPLERVYEFVFPTVVGPRYSNATESEGAAAGDQWIANPYLTEGTAPPSTFDLAVTLQAGMPLQEVSCGTHPVRIDYAGKDRAAIKLDGSEPNAGNRDFVLRYRLAGREVATGLLLHEDEKLGENFFLLTVQPPKRVTPKDIPGREYLFVVDVSGSMSGFPLSTAKELLHDLIAGLRPTDRFNILLFASDSRVLAERSLAANQANLQRGLRFLDTTRGGGGTELTAALKRGLNLPAEPGTSRNIVVVTDGFVGFERETFEVVRNNLHRANLFSFGIGSSVNRFCIEGLARAGQGEPFVVLDSSEAAATAETFRQLIAAPVLTDVRIDFGDFEVYDVEPAQVPDVFADRPLSIFGKFRGKPKGEISVTGVSGGEERTLTVPVEDEAEADADPLGGSRNAALPYLWARSRIARLSDYLEISENSDEKQAVTNLGLTYNLLTRYTSFVAVDEVVREAAGLTHAKVKQPLPLPKGVSNHAVGGGTIPEPASALLWLAGLFTLLFQRKRRRAVAAA